MATTDYGNLYWHVGVEKTISETGFLEVFADSVSVSPNGDLIFNNHSAKDAAKVFCGLILARDTWSLLYAAGVIDGSAIIVQKP